MAAFNGLNVFIAPPDTNISVGPDQVVEVTNSGFQVYDKAGNPLLPNGSGSLPTLFEAAVGGNLTGGSPCEVGGFDPVVLYDKIDHKWMIGQASGGQSEYCLAISATSDATGSYDAYDIPFGPTVNQIDYPKLAIWADGTSWTSLGSHAGVYLSAIGPDGGGQWMCGFPLSEVRSPSSSLTLVCARTPLFALPADLEGSPGVSGTTMPAPLGTPEYYVTSNGNNALNILAFAPDFSAGTASVSIVGTLPVAPFQQACTLDCVPQPGTTQELEALGGPLMYRLSYRNFGSSESMVVNHSVVADSSSGQIGVRWYQLSNSTPGTSSGWTVAQQGTFAPDDGTYRWMGSIAQDKFGDLGLGYSTSSGSVYPGIAYTGQTPSDPPNTVEAEFQAATGNGAQTTTTRWGDYSSMSLDPTDDCTFWYANEYLNRPGSNALWGAYIVAFRLGGCESPASSATLTPPSLNFGNQQVGTASAPQTVTLNNSGTANLSIKGIGFNSDLDANDFVQTNNCPSSLPPRSSCQINVTFAPATFGTLSSDLAVWNDPSHVVSENASVSGTATFVSFSSFSSKLEITAGPPPGFQMYSNFTLGAGGSINPLTQPVALQVGNYSVTIPPGSFKQLLKGSKTGSYVYSGTINGVSLQVQIVALGGSSYAFKAKARPADLTALSDPVPVTITIGNNSGTEQVDAQFQ